AGCGHDWPPHICVAVALASWVFLNGPFASGPGRDHQGHAAGTLYERPIADPAFGIAYRNHVSASPALFGLAAVHHPHGPIPHFHFDGLARGYQLWFGEV